ncbi:MULTISPECIES: YihY/virulence factor BrkB family protein [unclassified Caballeronia]|uniref:YihY/virulence factor BrkB family protein n=1 Tax=unclassified Caballeronia TaxID=2646786 RepID=UPI00285815DB|nr:MULTISPECIES: YihY/virulence factor BrkB family protein [unclassified Caballeronia]MDR5752543.1 YihY/virulence factor BrkB family protein [Caballeronia sp. LZ024]MDR5841699.1 YihY/virulence factor BrkB family protein [Caballeronia sp. LZ031]
MDNASAHDVSSGTGGAFAWPVRTFKRFSEDRCAPLAASIAFYSAFSLAPTLVMVIAVAGLVFGAEAARGQLFHQISGMLGKDAAASVQTIVEHAHRSGEGGIAAIVSFVLLAVGASATFSSLNTALSIIWPAKQAKSSVATLVKVRLISFSLVLGVAFLLIVSLVLDTAVQAAGKWVFGNSPLVILGDVVQFVLGFVILSGAFGALLKYLPDGDVSWREAFIGGAIAAVLFSVGKKLFAIYLTHAGMASAFGAAGSLAVLLMWLYFAAAVLLLGAEAAASRDAASRADAQLKEHAGSDRSSTPTPAAVSNSTGSAVTRPPLAFNQRAPSTQSRSDAFVKIVSAVRAHPSRLAMAAAGASLFLFTKTSRRPDARSRSRKA